MIPGRTICGLRLALALSSVSAIASCVPAAPAPTHAFSALVVFGDSLSDNGNLTGELNLVPPPPYAPGRYSNGDIWIDHVARHFDLPADPAYLGGTNFAHGGAGTSRGATNIRGAAVGFNLREQVNWYLDLYEPQGDELFIIWSGGNDLFDLLGGDHGETPEDAAANVAIAATVLYDAGARRFFIVTAPDLSVTPRYRGTSREQLAHDMTIEFNSALMTHVDQLASLRDIHVTCLDAAPIVRDLVEHPPADITNTTDPAWSGDLFGYLGDGEVAANPDAYLFWDRQHPTRMGHAFIADIAIATIEQSLIDDPMTPTSAQSGQSHFAATFSFWYRYLGI
ncbi:MAG: SGNH/GDSL hydrolase family protein [Phycisphaerales bacterium]|nr:SGNH/GDSL hydrolase family protein [Phycisphaerales bacterium]MCB9864349.1 SGNH/GDSL hydrolase family protein [Phycisphaerales bacterium]